MTENHNNSNDSRIQSISAPAEFSFVASEWGVWKKRFERYLSISGLDGKAEKEKIDNCLYIMGGKSEDILLRLGTTPETLKRLLEKFTEHFEPQVNIIFERYMFNSRKQKEFESVDTFITSLHKLAETCKFGDLREELIRDQIVLGIRNFKVSEKLQSKADLTLHEAILLVKQAENQAYQSKIMKNESVAEGTEIELNAIYKKENKKNFNSKKCFRCGHDWNNQHNCFARKINLF